MLDAPAKSMIATFPLGFVATTAADGRPSVSPKGTFLVLDDQTIAFGNIRSPGTLRNLRHSAYVCVNFIDVFKRKGLRLSGKAAIHQRGSDQFDALHPKWQAQWGELADRVSAIIIITVTETDMLTTPPYDDGATEDEMIAAYKTRFDKIYP